MPPCKHIRASQLAVYGLATQSRMATASDCLIGTQAAELRHWISHHARLGVGKMYIFDESAVSLEASLQDFIQSGLVAYHHLLMPLGQLKIYAGCLTNDRRKRHQCASLTFKLLT